MVIKMEKKKFFDLLYFILIISLIIFMIWIVSFMKGNAKECLSSPIGYFEAKNPNAVCNCYDKGNIQANSGLGFRVDNFEYNP